MKQLLIIFFFIPFISNAQNKSYGSGNLHSTINGHWIAVSTADTITTFEEWINKGQKVVFKKTDYNEKCYQWGGGCYMGMQFNKNGEFNTFSNVMCSTESSPKSNGNESWEVCSGNIICIKAENRSLYIKVFSIDRKNMTVIFYHQKP